MKEKKVMRKGVVDKLLTTIFAFSIQKHCGFLRTKLVSLKSNIYCQNSDVLRDPLDFKVPTLGIQKKVIIQVL